MIGKKRVGFVLEHYPMQTANAGLASLPLGVARARGSSSITFLVVGRQVCAGASLGFGNVGGVHFISQNLKYFASFAYNIFNFSGQYSLE